MSHADSVQGIEICFAPRDKAMFLVTTFSVIFVNRNENIRQRKNNE